MNSALAKSALFAALGFASSVAVADVTPTTPGSMPITFTESFEKTPAVSPCIPGVFFDTASVCAPTGTIQRVNSLQQGGCTEFPLAGSWFASASDGHVSISFSAPVEEFGGFFNTRVATTVGAEFYSGNTLVGSVATMTGGCQSYVWLGGRVTSPPYVDRIEISEFSPVSLQMDALQVDYYTDGPVAYCVPTITSNGCAGYLSWSGNPGIQNANLDFTVSAFGLEENRQGILFYGISGPKKSPLNLPGCPNYICVQTIVNRLGVTDTGGTGAPCTGSLTVDFDDYMQAKVTNGESLALGYPFDLIGAASYDYYLQGWFRDPTQACGGTTGSTNAIVFRLVE